MALNETIARKIKEKSNGDPILEESILKLLKGVEESRQLKRILDNIVSTL